MRRRRAVAWLLAALLVRGGPALAESVIPQGSLPADESSRAWLDAVIGAAASRWSLQSLAPLTSPEPSSVRWLTGLNSAHRRNSSPAAVPEGESEFRALLRSIIRRGSETVALLSEAVMPVEEGLEFYVDPDKDEVYVGWHLRF
jgi:hypothetical protein